jgi:hypothetical protein
LSPHHCQEASLPFAFPVALKTKDIGILATMLAEEVNRLPVVATACFNF